MQNYSDVEAETWQMRATGAKTGGEDHKWLEVAVLQVPLRRSFTYRPPEGLTAARCPPGTRLQVPFGTRSRVAVVLHSHNSPTLEPQRILAAHRRLDAKPALDRRQRALAQFVSSYYYLAPGQVLAWMLPPKLRKADGVLPSAASQPTTPGRILATEALPDLSDEQSQALQALSGLKGFHTALLHGVAGSGKTEVYMRLMQQVLAEGGQILYLVPEINLTPQAEKRIAERFAVPSACLHSRITPARRSGIWQQARQGQLQVIIGTRSAVFTPFARLGLVVVDEEHDQSFRQDQGAPYCARDIALWRGQQEGITVVLGSATPSLETLRRAQTGEILHLQMRRRIGERLLPPIELVDRRGVSAAALFSEPCVAAIGQQLAAGRQALLFLNQRGYARMLLCPDCGWRVNCHRCDATKTLHLKRGYMLCHHCEAKSSIPTACGECGGSLATTGAGTEKLMQWCEQTFPGTAVLRIDSDTTRAKGSLTELLDRAHSETPALLVGTQMLAKGHHLPHLGLVAVADISVGLMYPDFRSAELMMQTLIQVAGRAGREADTGRVMMETTMPSHPLLNQLKAGDYSQVAAALLERRRSGRMPPFSHLAVISAESSRRGAALDMLQSLRQVMDGPPTVTIVGPLPRAIERLNRQWRAVLQLKSDSRQALRAVLSRIEPEAERLADGQSHLRYSLVVDPLETI